MILILSDDVGYGDLGSYGAPDAKTPNLDRLAAEGVRFTESYANGAVCVPTRAALITGRYQQRVGLEWVFSSQTKYVEGEREGATWEARWEEATAGIGGLPVTGASLPALLKQSGYATGLIGKWHLGVKPEVGPNAHGFDQFFGFLGGAVDYYTHRDGFGRHDLYEDTTEVQVPRYLTDELTRRAVSFIDRHAGAPFFLELAYNATHSPFQPPDEPPDSTVSPWRGSFPWHPAPHRTRRDYVRMLERMDRGVGEVLRSLAAHGLTENTLVIFTSDNGGEWLSRNTPFFHHKGTLWEGGLRVPLIMTWPGRLPARKISPQVAITMDLTATILAVTGTAAAGAYPLDGINLLPIAEGAKAASDRDVFWRIDIPTRVQRAVRSGPWKLLVDGEDFRDVMHMMLFNLDSDPGERHDLAAQDPARVANLAARIDQWERAVAPAGTAIAVDRAVLAHYPGTYELTPDLTLTVTLEGNDLWIQGTNQAKVRAYAATERDFFFKEVDARVTFVVGADGTITGLVLHQGGQEMPGKRVR